MLLDLWYNYVHICHYYTQALLLLVLPLAVLSSLTLTPLPLLLHLFHFVQTHCSREKDADALPARLGQAYVAALQYNDALRCFHAACNANPANAAAKEGLRRINMILRGLDPDFDDENGDAPNSGDEQEEEEEVRYNGFSTVICVNVYMCVF
jgi:hypothetical protein